MKKNLDEKLYNDYLNGNLQAFEALYNKYKSNICFFIFNIIKDFDKAEDITQDVFLYILQNEMKSGYTFKSYIYLIAKSRAFTYLDQIIRRTTIEEKYLNDKNNFISKDSFDIVSQKEIKKEVLEAILELDEKYRNVVYLANIEELSYKEISKILETSISNIKILIYRGKKNLKKILLKKGYNNMNKIVKILTIFICTMICLTGITLGIATIYNNFIKEQNKIQTSGLYIDENGESFYENNLMENDMIWQSDVELYYKIITNTEDYSIYKSRIPEFPEISDINFDKNFVVVVANENVRNLDEFDMEIADVYLRNNIVNIVMKQKENPSLDDKNNVWYAIVDITQLADTAIIKIEHKKFENLGYVDFSQITEDYSLENAISEGCFTLKDNKIVSSDFEQLDKFIEKTKKGEESFIRVYLKYDEMTIIHDINYFDGMYYDKSISFENEEQNIYNNIYTELEKISSLNGEYMDIEYIFKGGKSDRNVYLAIIQNY